MKDPAVLFYTSDFLSGTMTMTNEEVGMYIRLLCIQHQKGKLTEKDMQSICKTYVQDVFLKFEQIDGFYVNRRMLEETEKRSKYSESRRNNAKKKAYAKHMVDHMGNENENEIENIIEDINAIKKHKIENELIHILEFEDDASNEAWKDWLDYRRGQRKSVKGRTKDMQLRLLRSMTPQERIATINQSITQGWTGLFEVKTYKTNQKNDYSADVQAALQKLADHSK